MSRWVKATWAWRMSIVRCSLYVFVGMGTLYVATVQNWDEGYVKTLRWWNWTAIGVSIMVNGCNSVIGFLDKTHSDEKKTNDNAAGSGVALPPAP
jgi:hypothetical protein